MEISQLAKIKRLENFSCIYKIVSIETGKIYVGSAKNMGIRRRNHICQLGKGKHHSIILQNHVNKYGLNDLKFEVIEKLEWNKSVVEREQYYIDLLNPQMNVLKYAGSTYGRKVSDETRLKLSESHKGYIPSNESREKMRKIMIGRKFTAESMNKMKESWKKRKNIRKVICVETGVIYGSVREAEIITGCDNIHGICKGLRGRKSSKGFTFKFYNNGL